MDTNREHGSAAPGPVAEQRVYTVDEAKGILRIGRNTMYGLIKDNDIASIKVGRRRLITREALDDFLANR